MVIHFDNRLPDPGKLADLFEQIGVSASSPPPALPSYQAELDSIRVIAAYESDQLIGFGRWQPGGSRPDHAQPDDIVVLPQYRDRASLAPTISKLLHAKTYCRTSN